MPGEHVGLEHRQQPHEAREHEAVDEDTPQDLALAADRSHARRADRQVLRADHLAHHAAGAVGGGGQQRVDPRDPRRRRLQRTEERVRGGVAAGEEHAQHADEGGEEREQHARGGQCQRQRRRHARVVHHRRDREDEGDRDDREPELTQGGRERRQEAAGREPRRQHREERDDGRSEDERAGGAQQLEAVAQRVGRRLRHDRRLAHHERGRLAVHDGDGAGPGGIPGHLLEPGGGELASQHHEHQHRIHRVGARDAAGTVARRRVRRRHGVGRGPAVDLARLPDAEQERERPEAGERRQDVGELGSHEVRHRELHEREAHARGQHGRQHLQHAPPAREQDDEIRGDQHARRTAAAVPRPPRGRGSSTRRRGRGSARAGRRAS